MGSLLPHEKTSAVGFAIIVLALMVLVFREHSIALDLRRALASNDEDTYALRTRVAALEKERDALKNQASAIENRRMPPPGVVTRSAGRMMPFEAAVPAGELGGPMAALDSPEMRRLMAIEQKGRLDARYAALFKALGLPPAKLEQLKQLLVDKQNAAMDVIAAARKQSMLGPGHGGEIQAMVQQENQAMDNAIRELLGDAAYQQYQNYDRTRAERSVVDQLNSRLSYTATPLNADQSEDLLDLLAASRKPESSANGGDGRHVQFATVGPGGDAMVSFFSGSTSTPLISDEAINSSASFLTPGQLAALRELQAEQQAQQQMSELLRKNLPQPGQGGMIFTSPPAAAVGVGG